MKNSIPAWIETLKPNFQEAIYDILSGSSISAAAKRYGINKNTLRKNYEIFCSLNGYVSTATVPQDLILEKIKLYAEAGAEVDDIGQYCKDPQEFIIAAATRYGSKVKFPEKIPQKHKKAGKKGVSMEKGFTKFNNGIRNCAWYRIPNQHLVMDELIRIAVFKPTKFNNLTLKRGQVATSYQRIANELGLTTEQVRKAIAELKESGELTYFPVGPIAVCTVTHYEQYVGSPAVSEDEEFDSESRNYSESTETDGEPETDDFDLPFENEPPEIGSWDKSKWDEIERIYGQHPAAYDSWKDAFERNAYDPKLEFTAFDHLLIYNEEVNKIPRVKPPEGYNSWAKYRQDSGFVPQAIKDYRETANRLRRERNLPPSGFKSWAEFEEWKAG